MRPFQGQSPPLHAAQQFVNSFNSLLRRLRPTSKCGAAPQPRCKNSINSNPRCPKPRFQPSKIAKRLVRNCRAKKCCIFSLKCLDVNNLIHNFVTQDRLHLGKAYKQACNLCSRFALSLSPKIGCTSAFLSPRANYK